MIKTKSLCMGVNNKRHPQNVRAGYDYNPAIQNLHAMFNFGGHGLNVNNPLNQVKNF